MSVLRAKLARRATAAAVMALVMAPVAGHADPHGSHGPRGQGGCQQPILQQAACGRPLAATISRMLSQQPAHACCVVQTLGRLARQSGGLKDQMSCIAQDGAMGLRRAEQFLRQHGRPNSADHIVQCVTMHGTSEVQTAFAGGTPEGTTDPGGSTGFTGSGFVAPIGIGGTSAGGFVSPVRP
ncbi:MAG: hypothetical protein KDJ41_09340 [Hyphomicrobiaceae bacterium]|nr:hypothetical protein [Hyphomicrobiaceae bacterium]